MTFKLKAAGLALTVALTLSAVLAQGAAAVENHHFTSEVEPTYLTGDDDGGEHIFKAGILALKCNVTTFAGVQEEKTADRVTVTPKYEECKLGSTGIVVHNEGCNYVFRGTTTTNPANTTEGNTGTVDLECGHGGRITVTGPGCDIEFSDTHPGVEGKINQKIHGVKYKTQELGEHTAVTAEAHLFGIKYRTSETAKFNCALVGKKAGTYSDGTLIGNGVLRGYADAAHEKQVNVESTVSEDPPADPPLNVHHHFTSESETTHLVGDEDGGSHVFKFGFFEVKCDASLFTGTDVGRTIESSTLYPAFGECKSSGKSVSIENENCKFVFHGETTPGPENGPTGPSATLSVDCQHTGKITIKGPTCSVEIADTHPGVEATVNQFIHGVKYKNRNPAGTGERTIEIHLVGLRYRTKDVVAGGCASLGKEEGTYSDGTYVGNTTVKGYRDPTHYEQINISITTTE